VAAARAGTRVHLGAHGRASRSDENLALELAPIRVNLIAAGFVDTPLSAALLGDQLDARREQLRTTLPIRRVVGPADIAALAVHLMTNTAVTGATFDIDGGQQLVEGEGGGPGDGTSAFSALRPRGEAYQPRRVPPSMEKMHCPGSERMNQCRIRPRAAGQRHTQSRKIPSGAGIRSWGSGHPTKTTPKESTVSSKLILPLIAGFRALRRRIRHRARGIHLVR